jgi:hypothetical protein
MNQTEINQLMFTFILISFMTLVAILASVHGKNHGGTKINSFGTKINSVQPRVERKYTISELRELRSRAQLETSLKINKFVQEVLADKKTKSNPKLIKALAELLDKN